MIRMMKIFVMNNDIANVAFDKLDDNYYWFDE